MISRKHRIDVYRKTVYEVSAQPFCYGSNDCLLFVAKAVERLIGVDHSAEFKPYNARGARRLVREAGGMVAFMSRFIGQPEPSLDGIRVCDPCLVVSGKIEAAGLWTGTHALVFKEGGGVMLVGPQHIKASWRVG